MSSDLEKVERAARKAAERFQAARPEIADAFEAFADEIAAMAMMARSEDGY